MEHFGMSLTSDWLTFIIHWNCFWISLSFSLPSPVLLSSSSLSSLFPFSFSSLFLAFAFTVLFWKALPVFPLLIFSQDVDGMLMLTWSSLVTFLVNFDYRFWMKTHLISLKNAQVPHIICLFWMLLHGWLTCLFFLFSTLLPFASDIVVSF